MVEALPASRPALLFRQATRVERPAIEGAIGSSPAHGEHLDADKPRGIWPFERMCCTSDRKRVSIRLTTHNDRDTNIP